MKNQTTTETTRLKTQEKLLKQAIGEIDAACKTLSRTLQSSRFKLDFGPADNLEAKVFDALRLLWQASENVHDAHSDAELVPDDARFKYHAHK